MNEGASVVDLTEEGTRIEGARYENREVGIIKQRRTVISKYGIYQTNSLGESSPRTTHKQTIIPYIVKSPML